MYNNYKLFLSTILFCFTGIILLNLTSCNKVGSLKSNLEFKLQQNALTIQGENYLKIAQNCSDNIEKNQYLLDSAELLLKGNNLAKSKTAFNLIEFNSLTNDQYIVWKILLAQINIVENNLKEAKNLIQSINYGSNNNLEIIKKLYQTRIKLFHAMEEPLEGIQEQVHLEQYLTTPEELQHNYQTIWEQLQQLSPSFLGNAKNANFSYPMQGWIEIAFIIKKYDSEALELAENIVKWQKNFPNHPANNILELNNFIELKKYSNKTSLNNLINSEQNITKLALLLPLSGKYKASGHAVKNGFIAASYYKRAEFDPEIMVFDTNQQSMSNIYKQILENKVDLIVGPLIKDEIDLLFKFNKINIPTLALNVVENLNYHNLFQFGLLPENEGQAIIEKARDHQHKRALIITDQQENSIRISKFIENNWRSLGNIVIEQIKITNMQEINNLLKKSLGIEQSYQRAKSLEKLGIKFQFEPRRRQDLDCIFLITNPNYARQVKPLLNFYYASKIPIYAPSMVYAGVINSRLDRDLDGIQFCDLPWVLDNAIATSTIYQGVKNLWQENFNYAPRLYALGIDAYKLTTQISLVNYIPEFGISGMTGILKINDHNIITRKLMWGKFENGIPVGLNQKN